MFDAEELTDHRRVWGSKRILRTAYARWYRRMCKDLSPVKGGTPCVELGSGSGNFGEWYPRAIGTDIVRLPWTRAVCDAHDLPFANRSVANIVMVDVLHHLGSPTAFLQEAGRVLTVGGRLLLVEPYPSALSLPVYRRFHPEPFDFSREVYAPQPQIPDADVTPNQAVACQLFFRNKSLWADRFGGVFATVKKQRMASVLYPASGGFSNRSLLPDTSVPLLSILESVAWPFHALSAFRCYVVLQRR